MALSKGNPPTWNDIVDLYSRLNTARKKFDIAEVAIPSNPGKMMTTDISNLKTAIESTSSNSYIGTTANTGVTVPNIGTLIYPNIFTDMSSTIQNIQDTCNFNPCSFSCFCGFGGGACCDFCNYDFNCGWNMGDP